MTQTIKKNFLLIVSAIVLALAVSFTATLGSASAAAEATDIQGNTKCGSNIGGLSGQKENNCTTVEGSSDIENLIRTIINVFSAIVGSISVIMIIIGGFRYITSAGDSNSVGGAKNTILYAIVGLIIVAFAQIIVQFVLQRTTG